MSRILFHLILRTLMRLCFSLTKLSTISAGGVRLRSRLPCSRVCRHGGMAMDAMRWRCTVHIRFTRTTDLGLGAKTACTLQTWLEADHKFGYPHNSHRSQTLSMNGYSICFVICTSGTHCIRPSSEKQGREKKCLLQMHACLRSGVGSVGTILTPSTRPVPHGSTSWSASAPPVPLHRCIVLYCSRRLKSTMAAA